MGIVTEQEIGEARRWLQDLIRIDTTNPPGLEMKACQYLAAIFDREKIPCKILESEPGRANLVARLKGNGALKPLLLTSHLDVVPVEREHWRFDPFGGEIHEGYIWGRGAVDMKQMTALELAVFLKAHREKIPLKRDLIFAAVADEEAGCRLGSQWLVANHPDLIRAEYALNEVGGFSIHVDDHVFYPIGVAEKGVCWFDITAIGKPGHGAMPHDDQAIDHLCLAAHKLAANRLPFHKTKIVSDFVDQLAARQHFPKNLILKATGKKTISDFILNRLFPDKVRARQFKNMYRNLATPTRLKAGFKENVIPSEATLTVDGRILPEHTVAGFLAEVQELIGPGFRIDVRHAEEACQTDYAGDFFMTLKSVLIAHHPGAVPVPFLIPGFTDAKHYQKLGIRCFGFAPTRLPQELNFGDLYHGHNERLPVEAIGFGVNVLWDVMARTCL
jgi:acetylornithine deacetylase/succinyl-diaminopimelate desuccinylase-like protein